MEVRRHSKIRCVTPSLSYSRLRSSPSTWTCAPFLSVAVNSASLLLATQRCHSVLDSHSPVDLFFHEVFVATEKTVKLPLLPSFFSASLPRNPIRVNLLSVIVFLRFCHRLGAPESERPPAPQARRCFSGGDL